MPSRPDKPGAGVARSRPNRITNKTRLKLLIGDFDVEPILLDEDEEKARGLSTAGVDADDANEHHLQAVLSAAALRHQAITAPRSTRSHDKHRHEPQPEAGPSASIPIPDATGIAAGAEKLYPPNAFKYSQLIRFSDTVEESIRDGLAGDGATYYMDEADKAWLDRRNADVDSTAPLSAAVRRLPPKGKGKDKDGDACTPPFRISEDEFELVIGILERHCVRAHPHLDVDFKPSHLPPCSEFEADLENLNAHDFSTHTLPSWLPSPSQLVRIARAVYPHWCQRRIARRGARIVPECLMDETQENEHDSYLCFRRREVKQLRKARKQDQVTVDRMLRLQTTLNSSLDLARLILDREVAKRDACTQGQTVHNARMALVHLKRKVPALELSAEDEELLHEKERPRKKARMSPPDAPPVATIAPAKVSARPSRARAPAREETERASETPARSMLPEIVNRFHERRAAIAGAVEDELDKRRAGDAAGAWADALDEPVQMPAVPPPLARFRPVAGRGMRLRAGRGGRMHVDRTVRWRDENRADFDDERVEERWKFDADGPMPADVDGRANRILVDDFHPNILRLRAGLWLEADAHTLQVEQTQLHKQQQAAQQSILAADHQIRISQSRREQIAPRPSPPVVVAPPMLQTPAIRPSLSPTTPAPPMTVPSSFPEVARTPTPAPVATPIRPPSVAPLPATTPSPLPMPIARVPTPAQPLRPVVNVPLRTPGVATPKPYNAALPMMNGHQQQNGMMVMPNGAGLMQINGGMMQPNGVLSPHLFPQSPRPMSRAATTAPNGYHPHPGAMQMNGVDARPKTAMSGMPLSAAGMMQLNGGGGGAMVPNQPMQTYAMLPTGGYVAAYPQMMPQQHTQLDAQQIQQLRNAFAQQHAAQQQQQQQQRGMFVPNMTGVNMAGMNLAMGNGNMALKMPMTRMPPNGYMFQQQQQQQQQPGGMPLVGMGDMHAHAQQMPQAQMMMAHPHPQQQRVLAVPNGQLMYAPVPQPQPTTSSPKTHGQGANGAPPVPAH